MNRKQAFHLCFGLFPHVLIMNVHLQLTKEGKCLRTKAIPEFGQSDAINTPESLAYSQIGTDVENSHSKTPEW